MLAPDLGVPWARDPSVLRALPGVEQAFENWATAREALLARGYAQTTLTNFEREGVRGTDRAFRYEECSFRPELHDALGFGPLSISTFIDPARRRAVKLIRGKTFREEAA
ncbi:MAG TPA: hypothetical protein PKN52_06870, partial [Trueperaceae bacterium]|nr:hypothetical protein [Trueperaceae bacterium]